MKRIRIDLTARSRRWVIFVLTSSLFVLSQFYRASIAVITPDLIADLSLEAAGLSLMSSAFFYAFALTQLPLGIYLDHLGPRRTMTVLSLVAVAGALVFAWADSLGMLIVGRVLLGVGMACNLMGSLKLITLWFGPLRFATLAALVISIGTAGNIVATSPLVWLVSLVGWRMAFSLFAALNLLLASVFYLVVEDRPPAPAAAPASLPATGMKKTLRGLRRLLTKRDYWIISLGTFCRYGIFAAVQALWAGPYLMGVMGLSPMTAGNLLLVMNLALILGGPLCGNLSDTVLKTRKAVIIAGLFGMAIVLGILARLTPGTGVLALSLLFAAFGFFSSTGMIMYTHIKEGMPIENAGTAMTGINFFTMIGAAAFLQGIGALMQLIYPEASLSPAAFNSAFLLCAACLAAVGGLYALTRETIERRQSSDRG